MVDIQKTWETVFFKVSNKNLNKTVSIELNYNHISKKYEINTPNQEMVSFKNDDIELSELKLEALKAAINYLKTL